MLTIRSARLALAGLVSSILSGQASVAVNIPDPDPDPDPDAVDAVLDQYVDEGYYPFIWVDPKREFIGVVMTQMWWIPEGGGGRDQAFRGELYRQFWAAESE